MTEIGLKAVRLRIGMSQQELAEKSGISRVTIGNLENGTAKNTTVKTLKAISGALNVPIRDLFFTHDV